ncbi:MAG TPA: response regulator transcription factor [Micromonosporaceae bacterium]|jgi:DNA-binding NarL/FixJ family response regulator
MTEPVRLVIADDHPVFRSGLRAMLDVEDGLEVVGEASSGTDVVALCREVQPDLVLMDLNMPGLDGVSATREILHESPHVRVLVLTMFDDDDSVFAAMRAGAHGYLLKGANHDEVRHAVHVVAAGGAMFGPAVAQRVIDFFARPRPAGTALAFPQLTDREHEILDLLAHGHANQAIATRLHLSPKTVRNHVSNIFTKLAVADRAQAIIRAREAGLGGASGNH